MIVLYDGKSDISNNLIQYTEHRPDARPCRKALPKRAASRRRAAARPSQSAETVAGRTLEGCRRLEIDAVADRAQRGQPDGRRAVAADERAERRTGGVPDDRTAGVRVAGRVGRSVPRDAGDQDPGGHMRPAHPR